MFEFSVIIPVYNRRENLYLTLCALDKTRAHYAESIEVIVSDDGSTDSPLEVMFEFQDKFALQYCWLPHAGNRTALTRNRGCAIARGRNFLFIDSDILLAPKSLAHLSNIARANPTVIIACRYDWMLPMNIRPYDVYHNWDKIVAGTLPPAQFGGNPKGIVGIDPRYKAQPSIFDGEVQWEGFAAYLYTGVLMFPRVIFETLGSFDESFVGHGGEDCEIGIRAQLAGHPVIFTSLVHGYHIYHDRDQAVNQASCNKNIQYIAAKHDLHKVGLYVWERKGVMGILPIGQEPDV